MTRSPSFHIRQVSDQHPIILQKFLSLSYRESHLATWITWKITGKTQVQYISSWQIQVCFRTPVLSSWWIQDERSYLVMVFTPERFLIHPSILAPLNSPAPTPALSLLSILFCLLSVLSLVLWKNDRHQLHLCHLFSFACYQCCH